MFRLTPPKHMTFYISVALATLAVILAVGISPVRPNEFVIFMVLLIGYLVLLAGVTVERL